MSAGAVMGAIWPFLVAGAAWAIAVWALRQPDAQSQLVSRLTMPPSQLPELAVSRDLKKALSEPQQNAAHRNLSGSK